MDGKLGRLEQSVSDAEAARREARAILAEPDCEPARAHFAAIASLLDKAGHEPPDTAGACDKGQSGAVDTIVALAGKRAERGTRLSNRIVGAMTEFRRQYPVETSELDNSVEAAHGYRELHNRLADDDLPRFQLQFKTYLNQNTIRDIAGFQSQLKKQADLIRERIDGKAGWW